MIDINKILEKLLNSGAASGFGGGMAGGLASSMLFSKSGRKVGKKAFKLGGIAAIGALAYTAYKRYKNTSGAAPTMGSFSNIHNITPAPAGSAFMPDQNNHAANAELGLILVRAMIAAARADGRLDAQESQAIFQKIETLGLDRDNQDLLVQEMGHPVDVDVIVNSASCPEVAAEIYVASRLAITVDTAAEKAYLSMLASRLELPPALVTELEDQVAAQQRFT